MWSRPTQVLVVIFFFFSSRRRHTRCLSDWSSDVCSSDLRSGTVNLLSKVPILPVMFSRTTNFIRYLPGSNVKPASYWKLLRAVGGGAAAASLLGAGGGVGVAAAVAADGAPGAGAAAS